MPFLLIIEFQDIRGVRIQIQNFTIELTAVPYLSLYAGKIKCLGRVLTQVNDRMKIMQIALTLPITVMGWSTMERI